MEALHHTVTLERQPNCNGEAELASTDSTYTIRHYVNRLASECTVLAVQQAALLKYHNSISVFPLATLRQTLTSALSSWPSSTTLWSIYVQVSHFLLIT